MERDLPLVLDTLARGPGSPSLPLGRARARSRLPGQALPGTGGPFGVTALRVG
jgi:hypothetical protein